MFGFGKKKTDLGQPLDESKTVKLHASLKSVTFPGFTTSDGKSDVVSLEWIGAAFENKGAVTIELILPTMALKGRTALEETIRTKAKAALGTDDVTLQVLSNVHPAVGTGKEQQAIPGVQNVILVASGKGGVGKSTVAINFAAALARQGCKVGLLDADVYGPSVPTMAGIAHGTRPGTIPGASRERPVIVPLERHDLKLMSMGFLVDTDTPMVWRGPMIASASMQMFRDVAWGDLDYLVVDLPPGTGDIHLTISQQILVSGAVIVSTPQDVALADVVRAKKMFDKVSIPCIGLVENMSYFVCDGCEKRHEIFDHGGARRAAEKLGLDFLSEIPLEPSVRIGGDAGVPVVVAHPDSASAKSFMDLASETATRLAIRALETSAADAGPSISITGGVKPLGKGKGGLPILG
jgi:ATP-binding protein involved in chromosome partitioning